MKELRKRRSKIISFVMCLAVLLCSTVFAFALEDNNGRTLEELGTTNDYFYISKGVWTEIRYLALVENDVRWSSVPDYPRAYAKMYFYQSAGGCPVSFAGTYIGVDGTPHYFEYDGYMNPSNTIQDFKPTDGDITAVGGVRLEYKSPGFNDSTDGVLMYFYSGTNRTEVTCSFNFEHLIVNGVEIVADSSAVTRYELEIPRGYAVVVDDSAHGYLQGRITTIGNTEGHSNLAPCVFATTTGMLLADSTQVIGNVALVDDGIYISDGNYTFYEATFNTAYGHRVLVNPYTDVTDVAGGFYLYARATRSFVIGSENTTDIPYTALTMYPITQTHSKLNYVEIDFSKPTHAIVNDAGLIVWDSSHSDVDPILPDDPTDPTPTPGGNGFWSDLQNLFTSGSKTLDNTVSSANGFFSTLRSIFGWLPAELVTLIYTAFTIIVIIGVVKAFL